MLMNFFTMKNVRFVVYFIDFTLYKLKLKIMTVIKRHCSLKKYYNITPRTCYDLNECRLPINCLSHCNLIKDY